MQQKNIRSFMEFATQRQDGSLDVDEFVERFPNDPYEQQILLAMLGVETGITARRNAKHINRLWVVTIVALALGIFSASSIVGIDIGPAFITAVIGGAASVIIKLM